MRKLGSSVVSPLSGRYLKGGKYLCMAFVNCAKKKLSLN